jgi:DNA mismatch endonuclease (patch repair protein)
LPRYRTVVLVNGCFWHRHQHCRFAYFPKSNAEKWNRKFSLNVARDNINQSLLLAMGWRVIVAWECGLRKNAQVTLTLLEDSIRKTVHMAEVIQLPGSANHKLR